MDATNTAKTVLAELSLDARAGLPEDLRHLIARYPREVWASHGNLGEMVKFWLSRHAMFRELGSTLDEANLHFRDGKVGAREFAGFFAPRLQFFLQQLHAHHHVEDDHYFPILRRADERLVRGFDILDRDHDTLAAGIESSVTAANWFLRALDGPSEALARAADDYVGSAADLLRGLVRHLDDEEDLIVPLILDRGEVALGVGH
jgi:hemerythrin-like domain-containing protein